MPSNVDKQLAAMRAELARLVLRPAIFLAPAILLLIALQKPLGLTDRSITAACSIVAAYFGLAGIAIRFYTPRRDKGSSRSLALDADPAADRNGEKPPERRIGAAALTTGRRRRRAVR